MRRQLAAPEATTPKNAGSAQYLTPLSEKRPELLAPMQDERQPLVCLDIKISLTKTEQLLIYEGEDIEDATLRFAQLHGNSSILTQLELPEHKRLKLFSILMKQVAQLVPEEEAKDAKQ